MKNFFVVFSFVVSLIFTGCGEVSKDRSADEKAINGTLDELNRAATEADFEKYFNLFAPDAVFIGTDATERWSKDDFMVYAKPHFDSGKTWSFTALQRQIYFDASGNTAWFDELLNTQMKICRGSGVLFRSGNDWKIKQYVLSMTIPNDFTDEVVNIKTPSEDSIIGKLKR
jgi:hypothetical protein